MNAQQFVKKFSTKKDALVALTEMINIAKTIDAINSNDSYSEEYVAMKKEIESFQDVDLAQQVLDFLNDQYGTQFKNIEKIKAITRQIPKASFDQFASIIMFKKETWGADPKMRDYLRPATLFGSKNKFENYLEDATHYWIKKSTHDTKGKI